MGRPPNKSLADKIREINELATMEIERLTDREKQSQDGRSLPRAWLRGQLTKGQTDAEAYLRLADAGRI